MYKDSQTEIMLPHKKKKKKYNKEYECKLSGELLKYTYSKDEKIEPKLSHSSVSTNNKTNKSMKNKDLFQINISTSKIFQEDDKDASDLKEDEFNFVKSLNVSHQTKRGKYPNSMLNMNFLPKELIYNNNISYKESSNMLKKTIKELEKELKFVDKKTGEETEEISEADEDFMRKNRTFKRKKEEKKGFFERFFGNFLCGCGGGG